MSNLSDEEIRKNCPHCNCDSEPLALKNRLQETDNFLIVCDHHPLTKGHILIMPKKHISCFAEYPSSIIPEFFELYKKVSDFICKFYGSISTFEHGKIGQTVYHSHIQMLPYSGSEMEIVPEGNSYLTKINSINNVIPLFKKNVGC